MSETTQVSLDGDGTVEIFPAERVQQASSPVVLVLPGGGYEHHGEREAEPVGRWLAQSGITAVVHRYPVAPAHHPVPIVAARRTLARLREGELGTVDTRRIAVMGFSAGGHLAATLSSAPRSAERDVHDLRDRPDLALLCYPVISMVDLPHRGCVENLLGPEAELDARTELSAELMVDGAAPPTFLWHAADDTSVPVTHSLAYARALSMRAVATDVHVYAQGGHGRGLATGEGPMAGWTRLALEWLRGHGW